jgi:hypothetical protein
MAHAALLRAAGALSDAELREGLLRLGQPGDDGSRGELEARFAEAFGASVAGALAQGGADGEDEEEEEEDEEAFSTESDEALHDAVGAAMARAHATLCVQVDVRLQRCVPRRLAAVCGVRDASALTHGTCRRRRCCSCLACAAQRARGARLRAAAGGGRACRGAAGAGVCRRLGGLRRCC